MCSEPLVRRGFQALQLVISDYLPALPTSEVPLCIVVATKFALQQVDINISLTAVGLLWSVADHLFHSQGAETSAGHKPCSKMPSLASNVVANIPNVAVPPILSPFLKSFQSPTPQLANRLWLLLFASLSDLCADPRAAVRKSASQTLFSTVTAHGTLLEDRSWGVVLWMVGAGDRPTYTTTNYYLSNPPSPHPSSPGPNLTWSPLTGAVSAAGAGPRADSIGLHAGPACLLPHPPHTQHCSEAVGGVSGEALRREGCVHTP